MAAIAGLNPYKTALDTFMEKTGMVSPMADNQFTRWGNRLEAVIADEYAEQVGVRLAKSDTIWHKTEPFFCTPDRLVPGEVGDALPCLPIPVQHHLGADAAVEPFPIRWALECKSRGARQADKWGESGSDQVPHDVAIQCHWSMMVTDLPRWDVAVLIGGNDFRVYTLFEDKEIQAGLVETARWFWGCVQANEPPELDGSESAHTYLRLKFPSHDADLIESTPELDAVLGDLRMGQMELKAAEDRVSRAQVAIKASIGDHYGLRSALAKVTWGLNKSGGIDYSALLKELLPDVAPEVVAKYKRPGSRVLRIKFSGED